MTSPWYVSSTPPLFQFGAAFDGTARANNPQQFVPQTAEQMELARRYLTQQKADADRAFKQKQDQIDNDYKLARQNARTALERTKIDKWYQEESIKNAQARLAEEGRQFDQRLAFDREVQAQNFGLNQAKLGYDLLNMQAQLRGPADYFAASNLARGAAAQPGTSTFLTALQNNAKLAGFGAQAGAPDAATVNGLAAKMGGGQIMPGTGGGAPDTGGVDALHREIQNIGLQGAHKLGAGALEQLTPTELALLKGGLETAGPDGKAFDFATFMDQYRRSRIGQGLGNAAAA